MAKKKRKIAEIRIPRDIFASMTEISTQINMKFATLLKLMMNSGVSKHLLTGNIDIPVGKRFHRDEKVHVIQIDQNSDWQHVKKKARKVKIYASEVLAVLLQLEIDECKKNKNLNIKLM